MYFGKIWVCRSIELSTVVSVMSSVTVGELLSWLPASHAKEQAKRIAKERGEVHRKRSLHRPELGRVKVKKSCKGNTHLYGGSFMMLLHTVATETWLSLCWAQATFFFSPLNFWSRERKKERPRQKERLLWVQKKVVLSRSLDGANWSQLSPNSNFNVRVRLNGIHFTSTRYMRYPLCHPFVSSFCLIAEQI
jgi:hypothetical protein